MIYAALILIFIGVLVVVYSLASGHAGNTVEGDKEPSGSARISGTADDAAKVNALAEEKNAVQTAVNIPPEKKEEPVGTEGPAKRIGALLERDEAVLFEDQSGMVDYESLASAFDPTLDSYKDIRRIGRGIVIIDRGGFSFSTEKQLFRFDFNRVSNIIARRSHMAVFLEKSEAVRLFLMSPENNMISEVSASYSKHREAKE
jgi:hypothetical protein